MSIARGSVTRGGITNGGILAAGILTNQVDSLYRYYSFYLDGIFDRVSGRSLSCLIPGARYDLVNGVQTAFAENTPVITEKGIRTVGAYQNLLNYSNDFSQWNKDSNVVITVGSIDNNIRPGTNTYKYSLLAPYSRVLSSSSIIRNFNGKTITFAIWIYPIKTISLSLRFWVDNSAVGAQTFNLSPNSWQKIKIHNTFITNTVALICQMYELSGITGDCFYLSDAQLTESKYVLPEIPTTNTSVASVSESGTVVAGEATNGIFADDVASNFALLNTSLQSQGTLTLDWTPGYSATNVSGSSLNIISFDGVTNHLSYDPSTKAIRLTDGTRTLLSPVLNIVANTTYGIKMSYGNDIMQLSVNSGDIAQTVFDGSFNSGSDMVIGLNNPELQYVNHINMLKEASHGTAATGLQEFFFNVINSTTISGVFQTTGLITVYWGDGTSNNYNGTVDQAYSKTYAAVGNYTVRVVGKSLITKFTMTTSGTNIMCNLADLPVNLNYFNCTGSNSITGNLSDLPVNLNYFNCTGSNSITGNLSDLPVDLTVFSCYGFCTIIGNFTHLSSNMVDFTCVGRNVIADYTSKIWPSTMNRIYHLPVSPGGLSSEEIDQLLIDLANITTWAGTKTVYLKGTNAPRTSASDAAKATLESKNVTVTTN